MEERKRHSRLLYVVLLLTLPVLAVALLAYVAFTGFSGIVIAAAPKLERTVTHTINQSIADIRATKGDVLILAELESLQTIRENDTRTMKVPVPFSEIILDVPLGTTVSEVRVPAHFRYFVRLSEPIAVKITEHGNLRRCVVTAPPLTAQTPVTFDTNRMEIRVDAGWLRFNKEEAKEKVIRSITPVLEMRAPENARLARDKARAAFAAFVRKWLLQDDLLGEDRISDIIVLFPGETDPGRPQALENATAATPD